MFSALTVLALASPVSGSETADGESVASAEADLPPTQADQQQQYSPIAIDQPVGHVRVAKAGDALGERRFMARSDTRGVVTVGFTRNPGRTALGIPLGAAPAGLPLSNARLTSSFGYRFHPLSGRYQVHSGIDLAAPTGTPVVATADGVVGLAGWMGGYGITIAIDHGGDTQTRYAHLSSMATAPGERVKKGQVIGYVGSTGQSTGPHLHYEVRIGQVARDPLR